MSAVRKVYLDYAATTPMASEAIEEMTKYLGIKGKFANSSSQQHCFGKDAFETINDARQKIATILSCAKEELIFTSGATESINLAISGIASTYKHKGQHIITAANEHKATLDTCKNLESNGFLITYIRPDSEGKISLEQLLASITPDTILVSIMHVNNETGVINNIDEIASALEKFDVFFHVDAAQSAGKLPINLATTPIDLLSISAHKIYGPKGIGCLYVRNRKKIGLKPLLFGGGQEYGLRPGTLPTHQIASFALAFDLAHKSQTVDHKHALCLQKALMNKLHSVDGVHFNGTHNDKLPNIINVSFDNVSADSLIIFLQNEVAIASGSACNSGTVEASHVLRSMGIEGDRLYGAVRISFGRYTTIDEITWAGQRICEEVTRLRELALE